VANACGNIASCEYCSLGCICLREEGCGLYLLALTQEGQPASNVESWREHGESAQSESVRIKSACLRKGCLLIFAVNTERFLASREMTALEFSSEAFEICDTTDSFDTCGESFRV
jgi:hypothetical protein